SERHLVEGSRRHVVPLPRLKDARDITEVRVRCSKGRELRAEIKVFRAERAVDKGDLAPMTLAERVAGDAQQGSKAGAGPRKQDRELLPRLVHVEAVAGGPAQHDPVADRGIVMDPAAHPAAGDSPHMKLE